MERITVEYAITCDEKTVEAAAEDIAFEQTVEVPKALVTSQTILENVVGSVEAITPLPESDDRFVVTIEYNANLANAQLPQLLNLVYGNISIKKNVQLRDIQLPASFLTHFRGPRFGLRGIRAMTGVQGRPLLATALKPRGASNEELAGIAKAFALGGGDLVKDDHNLVDDSFEAFQARVRCCVEAVNDANAATGRQTLYFPNLMAPVESLEEQVEFLLRIGVRGVLVCPFVQGLDTVRSIAERYPIAIMTHPAFSGSYYQDTRHGISPGVLLGTLMRLIGADASVFPNYAGRFSLSHGDCMDIARRLHAPLGACAQAWPAPAGGMNFERIGSMAREYKADSILLIGGALLADSTDLETSTRRFVDEMRKHFSSASESATASAVSSCEIPVREAAKQADALLRFDGDSFSWSGRAPQTYKTDESLPFHGVTRHELIGKHGERTSYDLRYFEIAPGGYTSLEKHHHTHTVIAVRGKGVLIQRDARTELHHLDIAYIDSLEPHQLRNEGDEAFGFFCLVDHLRDRPL